MHTLSELSVCCDCRLFRTASAARRKRALAATAKVARRTKGVTQRAGRAERRTGEQVNADITDDAEAVSRRLLWYNRRRFYRSIPFGVIEPKLQK